MVCIVVYIVRANVKANYVLIPLPSGLRKPSGCTIGKNMKKKKKKMVKLVTE